MKTANRTRKLLYTLVAVILISGFFYGGFRFGISRDSQTGGPVENKSLQGADFSLFWDAVQIVKDSYFDAKDVNDKDMLYGAIQGVLTALDDPYSSFFNPSDAKKFNQDLSGSFGGIGAEIGIRNNHLVVVAPLKGNPAEAVGLKPGDRILRVNEEDTEGWSVEAAVKLIRGEPGTLVKLNIYREGWSEPKDFEITRQIIEVPTIDWYMVPEEKTDGKRIAYFHLYNFNGNAPQVFFDAAREALFQGAQGVILDLRNNPGGFLEVSTNIAGWFLKRGEIVVTEEFRSGDTRDYRANGNSALADSPVVVLVNAGSASASEIIAGALRDKRNALLIGEKTFGKGTVQEVETLKDGSSIKVSVAQWLTPNGTEINKKGLEPDIEVKNDTNKSSNESSERDAPDLVLEKGIEILKGKIPLAPKTIILF